MVGMVGGPDERADHGGHKEGVVNWAARLHAVGRGWGEGSSACLRTKENVLEFRSGKREIWGKEGWVTKKQRRLGTLPVGIAWRYKRGGVVLTLKRGVSRGRLIVGERTP